MKVLRLFEEIKWRKLLKGTLVDVGLFLIVGQLLYMLFLHAGPSVETVRQKVAVAMGVPPVELVCVGGRFRRESRVLFHQDGDTPFAGEYEEIPPDKQTFEMTMSFLKEMNVNIDKDATVKVFKFPMEFDTVFCVVCGKNDGLYFMVT